jgi:hypothetical protein
MTTTTEDQKMNPRTGHVTIVADENDLPAWPETTTRTVREYVRLLSDQSLLQDQHDATLYARRDGKRWSAPGFKVTRNKINNAVSVESATAPEDHTDDRRRQKSAA